MLGLYYMCLNGRGFRLMLLRLLLLNVFKTCQKLPKKLRLDLQLFFL